MLYTVQIRVKTPLLGDKRGEDGVRRFDRTSTDVLALDPDLWQWMLNSAAESMGALKNVDLETIMVPPAIQLQSIQLYTRRLHTTDGTPFKEMHEAVNTGTVLTFDILVTAQRPGIQSNRKRPPDYRELQALFIFAGQYMGISPFGITRGFGRFELLKLENHATNQSATE